MDIDSLLLPKQSGIEKIRNDCDRFIDYFTRAKGVKPDRLIIDEKVLKQLKRSLAANKHSADNLRYKMIPIEAK